MEFHWPLQLDSYWQMLDVMTHVTPDGIYRLSPQPQPEMCLGLSQTLLAIKFSYTMIVAIMRMKNGI